MHEIFKSRSKYLVSSTWTSLTWLWWFGLVLGSIQFHVLTKSPLKMLFTLKVVKSVSKIIIMLLLPRFSLNPWYTRYYLKYNFLKYVCFISTICFCSSKREFNLISFFCIQLLRGNSHSHIYSGKRVASCKFQNWLLASNAIAIEVEAS